MSKWIFTCVFLLGLSLFSPAVFGQTASFKKTCKKYFKITGSEENFKSVLKNMIKMYKESETMSIVPAEVWDEMEKDMIKEMDDLYDKIAIIYDKHFTEDDLKAIITFYESPIGKKMVKEMPEIMQESMDVGRIWGEEIGRKIGEKLEKKGYKQL